MKPKRAKPKFDATQKIIQPATKFDAEFPFEIQIHRKSIIPNTALVAVPGKMTMYNPKASKLYQILLGEVLTFKLMRVEA